MTKFLKIFSKSVIVLFALSIFGWMVHHMTKGDKKFGFLKAPVEFLYTFPDMFSRSVEEVKKLPATYVATPENFRPVNKLDKDLIVFTTYTDLKDRRSFVLLNLKNDSVLYKWTIKNPFKEHNRIMNPLLLDDKSIIYAFSSYSGLSKIDSLGKLIWQQDSIHVHHSLNFDSKGDVWTCTYAPGTFATGYYFLNGRKVYYKDNYITKVDSESGRILFHKSLTEILRKSQRSSQLLKSSVAKDPLHLNDVQPALKSTEYYQEDDVFISIKNISAILHYRPSTDSLIAIIEGPFVSQHDVDFYGDHSLVLFNNNYYAKWSSESLEAPSDSSWLTFGGDFYSNIVEYNLENKVFTLIGDSLFRANSLLTHTEGLMEFLEEDTYFVEEQNTGLLWVFEKNSVLYKNVMMSQHEGYHHLPNWTRIISYND